MSVNSPLCRQSWGIAMWRNWELPPPFWLTLSALPVNAMQSNNSELKKGAGKHVNITQRSIINFGILSRNLNDHQKILSKFQRVSIYANAELSYSDFSPHSHNNFLLFYKFIIKNTYMKYDVDQGLGFVYNDYSNRCSFLSPFSLSPSSCGVLQGL